MNARTTGKSWTVMVYMAGDNNLDPEGVQDLIEMKKVGSTDKVNVVAQFDRAQGHVARRYYLTRGGIVTGDAVESLGQVNTGDPKSLIDFATWGIKRYPAEHFFLILWNHGQGWDDTDIFANERFSGLRRLASGRSRHGLFHAPVRAKLEQAKKDPAARAILIDDNAKDFLDNHEMSAVLDAVRRKLGRKLDILGMDACLMSMVEVGCQIDDGARFTVGSEETEPGEGWPYDTILAALAADPAMTPEALARLVVKKYLDSYRSGDGVTQSACDLAAAKGLASAVASLARSLKKCLKDDPSVLRIQAVRSKVQSYEVTDNIDLVDFCTLLAQAGMNAGVSAACKDVIDNARKKYVIAQGFKGDAMKHSNGVAIYFPLKSVSPLYPGLAFSKASGWDDFLTAYLDAIHRR